MSVDGARFASASQRFRSFFTQLDSAFAERTDVLNQMALALLAKEHVLLAGPPGTAKSQIASAVFGRIVCEESGAPSVYARQITENTVQTDLIGPIDFKNLTETGRTTHFTDEGMLGSVHAFLDEVFDGRDMLLRSALNVLQERELKQGGTITRGRIECALMTSNRYVSEIIEQSRETLLAFIDRVAFIGFVPRGFADKSRLATVLRRNVGGTGKPQLDALLTIQDVDVLQAAVDEVHVAPELCDLLAELIGNLDSELAAASRADPTFVPTRYLSTRTAVRCGRVLRAATVLSKILETPSRDLIATQKDLRWLRLNLLLSGPSMPEVEELLRNEVDPVEKRQLSILRTEREIFDACLRKLPATTLSPKPKPEEARQSGSVTVANREENPLSDAAKELEKAISTESAKGVLKAIAAIVPYSRAGSPLEQEARALLERAQGALRANGLKVVLHAGTTGQKAMTEEVRASVDMALALEDGTASMHTSAKWMQERALDLIDDVASLGASGHSVVLQPNDGATSLMGKTQARLAVMRGLAAERRRLLDSAATARVDTPESRWSRALQGTEALLAAWWSAAFGESMSQAVQQTNGELGPVLAELSPMLEQLDRIDAEIKEIGQLGLAATHPQRAGVKRRVVGPRLGTLIRAAMLARAAGERATLAKDTKPFADLLRAHGLHGAVPIEAWLTWCAEALAQEDSAVKPRAPLDGPPTYEGYRALRTMDQRFSLVCVLAEVAMVVAPELLGKSPNDPARAIAGFFRSVDTQLTETCIRLDLQRIARSLDYLEQWMSDAEKLDLAGLARSRIYDILWDESALARFSTETRLIEELFPDARERVAKERARIEELGERAIRCSVKALEKVSDLAWAKAP